MTSAMEQEQAAASNRDEDARLGRVQRRLDDIAAQLRQVEEQLLDAKSKRSTEEEIPQLDKAAKVVLIWLVVAVVSSFVGGCYLLLVADRGPALGNAELTRLSSITHIGVSFVALIGVSGSSLAALISALRAGCFWLRVEVGIPESVAF